MKDLGFTLAYISIAALICNVLVYFWKINKFEKPIQILGVFLCLNILAEFSSKYIAYYFEDQNNLLLLHIYTLFEFVIWSLFYQQIFKSKKLIQKIFPWFIGSVSIVIITNSIFIEPISSFNSNAKTLVQTVLIGYAIYYFFDAFGKTDLTKPLPRSLSIINFAVILYYSGSLFIFMFSKMLTNNRVDFSHQYGFWAVNALLNIIFQLLIFISLWTVAFRKTKSL